MKSLAYTLLVLFAVIYGCSVLFTQVVVDAIQDGAKHAGDLEDHFGSMGKTALTLFESIVGGLDWRIIVSALNVDISPMVGGIFCFYVAFCLFVNLNLVT